MSASLTRYTELRSSIGLTTEQMDQFCYGIDDLIVHVANRLGKNQLLSMVENEPPTKYWHYSMGEQVGLMIGRLFFEGSLDTFLRPETQAPGQPQTDFPRIVLVPASQPRMTRETYAEFHAKIGMTEDQQERVTSAVESLFELVGHEFAKRRPDQRMRACTDMVGRHFQGQMNGVNTVFKLVAGTLDTADCWGD
ncbi:hypothetical protein ACYPKM_01515 [Pseudomonas aeruginosa]